MTEAKWLACKRLQPVLEQLVGKDTERKNRLLEIACLRYLFWHLLTDDRTRAALEVAERHADGAAGADELRTAGPAAIAAYQDLHARYFADPERPRDRPAASFFGGPVAAAQLVSFHFPGGPGHFNFHRHVVNCVWIETCAYELPDDPAAEDSEANRIAMRQAGISAISLVRDVYGNPFRPAPAIDPAWHSWRDGAVSQLARDAYAVRHLPAGTLDPQRLAVLADALEDASCHEAVLLGHLRGPGPHVRGCFVVDLLLGKC